ncbi:MAG: amino acid adenylation domain-containing protein, partial [Longimicrobiaceae bacterium]
MSEALDRLARLPPEKRLLLQKMLREKAARGDGSRAGIRRREAAGPVPLSFAQRRLWFLDRMEPGSPAYDVPTFMRLRGALDASALVRALGEIVRRHESLRTVFPERGGEPVQVVLPPGGFPVPRVDLRGLAGEVRVREVARLALAEGLRPFDLERGPVARATLLLLAADDSVLLVNTHHIVTDEWSVGVMMREVSALYGAFARGEPSPLPEPEIQFSDYALWQHEHLAGELLEAQLAFWREKLAGAPPLLEIPVDRPRRPIPGPETLNLPFGLPREVAGAVRALARAEGATLFMTLLAGFQALLARWSGTDDVSVGTPIAGRTRAETEGLIGYLANTLVVRADLSDDPTGRALLARVREAVLGAHAHQEVPFERLVEELAPERSLSHSPLFQVMFALESYPEQEASLGPLEVDIMGVGGGAAKFDLTAIMTDLLDTIDGRLSGRAELFDEGSLARLRGWYAALVAGMAADPDRPVSAIPLLDAAERARLLDVWSAAGEADPAPRCLHALFAEQAARRPGATALVHGAATVTYAELDRRSDALAHRLAALGVGPDVRVGICMERSPALVAGLLGILKAGGAYVPLDPQFPDERLAFVLADAGAPALVTEARLAERFAGLGCELVVEDAGEVPRSRAFALPRSPSPENLACVVYTSGSTGQPKGTGVPHRAVPGFFRGVDYARFDEEQVLLQHSAVSWDALTLELWPALLTGGVCVLYPGGTPEPEELARQVRDHGVTTLWLTSAFFNLVVDTCPEVLGGVRQVMTGGEAVSAEHVRRALELSPGLRLVNGYGPSECTVFSTAWVVPAGFRGDTVPIGRPVGDRRVYLLDRSLEPVPAGVPGELYVGGPAVARGYLGRPEPTAAAFVPDPFGGEPGARLYRTGDRARRRADGVLEFAGRVDQQVKVRGFRVEPGEVEATLAGHPAVREAAVVAREAGAGERRLVGYVTAEAGAELSPAELRAYLGGRIPAYMVPDALVVLDAMPLTPHGKTDRRALPAPGAPEGAGAYVPPRTPVEEALAAVWAEVLGVGRVGAADDFFALGGQSLLAMRVVARLREALGVELPLRAVFEAPTLAGLAERIGGPGAAPLPPIPRRAGEGPPPLSFAQQRLWLIDRMEPGSAAYNMPAGLRLRGRLDVAVLERTLGEVVRRHESLRTVFGVADGHPVQTVLPAAPARIPVVELAGLPGEARERALRRLAAGEAGRPFDLARGPLLRTVAVRLEPGEHAVLFTMHHVVGDGWSMGVLVRELSALYEAFARGEPSPLPALPVQYPDYAVWQRGWLTGEVLDAQLAFWRERLAGAPPVLDLPTDRPRPPTPGARGAAVPFALGAEAARGLRALARSEGATLFAALLAGVQALLGRWAGVEDVVVGTPTAGRTRAELEGLIGFFVNTLALRTDLSGDPTPRVLVRRARETVLGAQAHQDVPFERLVEELAPERSLRHTPLFQALFALQNNREEALSLGSLELEPLPAESGSIRFDLELSLAEQGDGVRGVVAFRTALFDASTMERLASHLAALLAGMAADPDGRLADIDLMDAAERERVLVARNDTAREYPPLPAHLLFAEQAVRTPHAVAVLSAAGTLTYAELDARAEELAARLRRLGVGPEVPVGLCVERTAELVVGVLGIWKAGGAYVPLDPSYPTERLELIARDAALRVVVASAETAKLVPEFGGEIVLCDAQGEHDGVEGAGAVAGYSLFPVPCSLAYVISPSGSTGAPKGVHVQHGSLSNLLHAAREAFGVGAGDVVPVLSSSAFDIWLFETLLPLSVGAAVRLVERERVLDPAGLVAEVSDATALHAVPALMRQVVREAAGAAE